MSYHYPHHVGKILPAGPANTRAVEQPAGRHPGTSAGGVQKILRFAPAARHQAAGATTGDDLPDPQFGASVEIHDAWPGPNWRDGAALAGGLLLPLVTACLIWAALSEAVLAAAGAL
jgi:hypothetical protein